MINLPVHCVIRPYRQYYVPKLCILRQIIVLLHLVRHFHLLDLGHVSLVHLPQQHRVSMDCLLLQVTHEAMGILRVEQVGDEVKVEEDALADSDEHPEEPTGVLYVQEDE